MSDDVCTNILFQLNDERVMIDNPDPQMTLLDYLRCAEVGLTGTKSACGDGGCGACTVMISRISADSLVTHSAVNACLLPICTLNGARVTTVEGIGDTNRGISRVQRLIAESNGSQCGSAHQEW